LRVVFLFGFLFGRYIVIDYLSIEQCFRPIHSPLNRTSQIDLNPSKTPTYSYHQARLRIPAQQYGSSAPTGEEDHTT
jgi:hypothetical protein